MKILKIIFISILVFILVLTIAATIFIKTFDINRYKPVIIAQASTVLHRQINFKDITINFSLKQGIGIKIANLSVSENPAFQEGNFLTVKNISIGIDIFSYLIKKEITISGISIDAPELNIIRNKNGEINIQSFAEQKLNTEHKDTQISNKKIITDSAAMPFILIKNLEIINANIIYIDKTFEPAITLPISNIKAVLGYISLKNPFPFKIEASILSENKNITIEGKIQINLAANKVKITGMQATTNLSELSMEKLQKFLPMIKDTPLPQNLKGSLNILIEQIEASENGLLSLSGNATLANGSLSFKEIAKPLNSISGKFKLTQSDITTDNLSATLGKGKINASVSIKDYLGKQAFSIKANLNGIDLSEIAGQKNAPIKFYGIISATLEAQGEGFKPEVLNSLSGKGEVEITDAKLVDLNVLKVVLDKLIMLPNLSEKIQNNLPEHYKQQLNQKDTLFHKINLPVTIQNGYAIIKPANIEADEFMFDGEAQAAFDAKFSVEGSFLIPADLSGFMVEAAPELQYLLNTQKQIYIPLKVSGSAANMKFTIDAEYIAKKLIINQGKNQLIKIIDKALGGKNQNSSEIENTQGNQPNTEESKPQSSRQEVIGSILDTIFK